jgi:hypothetical protein
LSRYANNLMATSDGLFLHWTSTRPPPDGRFMNWQRDPASQSNAFLPYPNVSFVEEAAWALFRDRQAGTVLLYECGVGTHTFLRPSAACDGQTNRGPVGYVYDAARAQPAGTVPLYSCSLAWGAFGDHFVSENPSCEGQSVDLLLGFAPQRLSPRTPGSPAGVGFYALYNPGTFEHLYTTDANEYAVLTANGWSGEGIAFRGFAGLGAYGGYLTVPLYRLSAAYHAFTTSGMEYVSLRNGGYTYEFVAGYVLNGPAAGARPLYRLTNGDLRLLTIDQNQYDTLRGAGWTGDGVIGWALPP